MNRFYALALTGLALVAIRPVTAHPVYIGRIDATLEGSALRGRLSVNRLDFLQVLAGGRLDRLTGLSRAELDSLSFRYLQMRLVAIADGDTLALSIDASGQERDEVWFDWAFPAPATRRDLVLGITVLFELAEQRNLLQLTTPTGVRRHVYTSARPWLEVGAQPP